MSMTSRARVLAAINHQEPDRVPLDLGSTRVTGIEPSLYHRMRERLNLPGDSVKVIDVWQMLAWVEQPVVEALGVDCLGVPRLVQDFGMRIDAWRPWRLDDGTPVQAPVNFDPVPDEAGAQILYLDGEVVAKKVADSIYFDRMIEFKVYDPLPPVETFKMPLFTDDDLAWRRHWAETLRSNTDKAILGEFGPILGRWGSYQEWLYTIAANPEYVRSFYERKIEMLLANARLYWDAVGNNVDIVWWAEDFGTQKGLMISPRMFNELVAPYYKRLFDWVHQNTTWKVFFHCCGAIRPIIPTFIDCGVDILNPVQTSARGMDPTSLKADFGDRLSFWGGGIDTQTVLPFGSLDEIRAQVNERIQILGRGGGFVFNPVHNIQGDVSVERVLTMIDAVHAYGRYPL